MVAAPGEPASRETLRALERALDGVEVHPVPAPPRARIFALRAVLLLAKIGVVLAVPLTIAALIAIPAVPRLVFDVRVSGLGYLTISGIGAVVYACRNAWRGWKDRAERLVLLGPRDAPILFGLLGRMARVADTEPPDEVAVGWSTSFAVSELETRAESGRPRRRLYFEPANYGGLSLAELSSILIHELGHYRGGHTSLSARLFRGARRLHHLEWILRQQAAWRFNPIWWVAALAVRTYARLYGSVSRTQEREADELAFRVVGGACFERGLERVHVGGLKRDVVGPRAFHQWAHEGERESGSAAALMRSVEQADLDPDDVRRWLDEVYTRPARPLDSHPPAGERARAARDWDRQEPRATDPDLLAGGDPWPLLFGTDLARIQQRVLEVEAGVARQERAASIGVRGPWLGEEEARSASLDFETRRFGRMGQAMLVIAGVVALLLGGLLAIASEADDEWATARNALAIGVLFTGFGVLGLRRRLWVDRSGYRFRGRFGTRAGAWEDVVGIKIAEATVAWQNASGEQVVLAPSRADRELLVDLLLEVVPCAAVVGWGTGLARVPRPIDAATLPDAVKSTDDGLDILGPGEQRVLIDKERADFQLVRDFVNDRLLEWVNTGRRPKHWRDSAFEDGADRSGAGAGR